MQILLIAAQIAVLLVIGLLLWQIWHFLKRGDISDEEPLGEERAKYFSRKLTWLIVCFGLEAGLQIISTILRILSLS